jgi:hypothetical protein
MDLLSKVEGGSLGCRATVQESEVCVVDTAGSERTTVPRHLPHVSGASQGLLAGVTGRGFRSGAAHPMEEIV